MTINEKYEERITRYKAFIQELSVVQDAYFENLCREIKFADGSEEHVFDYVFNDTENVVTLAEYAAKYGFEGDIYECESAK
jgi:Na+-translocating ferredoxin:NAD+ oxidoreductase RnfG subunit